MKRYYNNNREGGFIRWIIIIAIALVLASYFFDFSVQDAVEDEQTQSNFSYISTNVRQFWDNHLSTTAHYLWDDVFIDLLWDSFTANLEHLKEGENTIFEDSSPGVDLVDFEDTTGSVTNPPVTAGFVNTEE